MDEPSPLQSPAPESPAPGTTPTSARDERIEARLQTLIDPGERIVAWAQGWVSRETWLPELLASRTLDFAVLTDHSLFLVTTGFFTRRPRRCVYASRLNDVFASRQVVHNGRRLRITTDEGNVLLIELRATDRGRMFAAAVVASAGSHRR